jgi:hypothetical protein
LAFWELKDESGGIVVVGLEDADRRRSIDTAKMGCEGAANAERASAGIRESR